MWLVALAIVLFGAAIFYEIRNGRKTSLKITIGLLIVFVIVVIVFWISGIGQY
jgi:hypothetical protein